MSVTIYSVAQKANVSVGTASRVLNGGTKGKRRDALERAERILKAAAELGYQPSLSAKAVATGRTGHIGYIISDHIQGGVTNQYYSQILAGAEQACSEHGYLLNIAVHNLSNIDTFIWPRAISSKGVDGVILAGEDISPELLIKFENLELPFVSISDSSLSSANVKALSFDVAESYFIAVKHAAKVGYQRLSLTLNSTKKHFYDKIRSKMQRDPITSSCTLELLQVPNPDFSAAEAVLSDISQRSPKDRPELILTSDHCALGLIRQLANSTLTCPDDIGIISLSDSSLLDLVTPSITAVNVNLEALGKNAACALLKQLNVPVPDGSDNFSDQPTIIQRQSIKEHRQ